MMYHAIHLNNNLVVRPVVDGITDLEWFHGCRCFEISESRYQLEMRLRYLDDKHLLTIEEWSQFISSLDDPDNVTNNNFISTYVKRDKWDLNRPIY